MHRETLIDLLKHMEWADARMWSAILGHAAARDDEKVRQLLFHTHIVQRSFLKIWRGEDPSAQYPSFEDSAGMVPWAKTRAPELLAHIESLGEADLAAPIKLPWTDMIEKQLGTRPESTNVGETALQVVLHSVHHRAQIGVRLRELGGEPPPLNDYIAWLWRGRPAASWPDVASEAKL